MKMRIASLSLLALCLTLAAIPAMASDIYDNGANNGTADAWTINFGFAVTDSSQLLRTPTPTVLSSSSGSPWRHVPPWSFDRTSAFGGDVPTSPAWHSTQGNWDPTSMVSPLRRTATSLVLPERRHHYWLNLQNASVTSGDPVYWDENSGPSHGPENSLGTVPSEVVHAPRRRHHHQHHQQHRHDS